MGGGGGIGAALLRAAAVLHESVNSTSLPCDEAKNFANKP